MSSEDISGSAVSDVDTSTLDKRGGGNTREGVDAREVSNVSSGRSGGSGETAEGESVPSEDDGPGSTKVGIVRNI